ncbi:AAA family ATPase [Streptomyces sp. NPDC056149]|uniref:AAA family ATPase n=1 Tax=unclassified Streptomyces TaxID=2593676 RepID=UPI0023812315|nr:AAA family ATPase [Streptomyces sp. WZ-12]
MTRSLFDERLAVAEERLRHLYLRREGDDEAEWGAPLVDPHEWPDPEDMARLAAGGDRLAHVAGEFGLTERETDLLVTCLLPELNPVCGSAIRLLSGLPVSRPTVAVALSTHGIPVPDALADGLLREGSPLLDGGLVRYENPEASFLERVLNVHDRVLDFLTGQEAGARCGVRWLRMLPPHPDDPRAPEPEDSHGSAPEPTGEPSPARALVAALATDPHRACYLRQGIDGEALPTARAALATLGRTPLLLDPDALATDDSSPAQLAQRTALEARLLGAALLVPVPPPGTAAPERCDRLRGLVTRLDEAPLPLLLYGGHPWVAHHWDTPRPAEIDLRAPAARRPDRQLGAAASAAVEHVHRAAALRAAVPTTEEVRLSARRRSAAELGALARHIVPEVGWQDLVLPAPVRLRLDMLTARVRHRDTVFGDGGLRRGGGRGRGTTALFAGESGTGKTMAAEAVAQELGLDLYVVSLPSLVSKYIGETEKNLERVFSAADMLDAVVLFDEADAMFAKRGEVKGSNDRHANMQSGYLLQRLEAFNGLAVLTTNLRANIDTAFTRRFDEVIHFESPGPEVRTLLWRSLLGASAPAGLDVESLAQAYDLAGGSIRACVESAAFAAAAAGRPLTEDDLLQGIETEYGKLGRLFARREA